MATVKDERDHIRLREGCYQLRIKEPNILPSRCFSKKNYTFSTNVLKNMKIRHKKHVSGSEYALKAFAT